MGTSLMNHVAELFFRLKPKRTEGDFDALLTGRKTQPERPARPPRFMGTCQRAGEEGRLLCFGERADSPYTVFYCHGGGYTNDFSYFHWRFLKKIMDRTGAAVVAPAYPLAPYGTWAEAFRLILPAFIRCAENHPDRKLILMGDSAGGGLAAALALELAQQGERRPDELILLSPWMDVTMEEADIGPFVPLDPWITPAYRACGRWWAGALDVRDPRVSPAYGPVEELRHVTVFCGTREVLNPDSVKLYGRLDPEGDNELIVREGMFHVYPLLPIPEAKEAVDRIVEKIVRKREEDRS